ncbi:DNA-primase RepB domain-containing protein [Leptothoe sp. PORK10 BA2]|uniref:DNA-primase RepB domain-containing protein n=1 Tax=Leptothoe sp. PORK10 BA2 TaxID=3110254 RepID=UPI002B2031AF|nr:DNA-primase RepB domain-containing protein [Leptothoe sp. PORK10 BA2]
MSKSISPLKKVSKHCLWIDKTAVKYEIYIDALLAVCPDKLWPLVCEFEQAPKIGNWTAKKLTDLILRKFYHRGNNNRYITISVFKGNKRRKTEFVAMVAVMIDDVGTKVPFEKIVLPPTYWLETSPGNYQAWYFLSVPVTDRQLAESVLNALVAQGLATDGKDPGMKGVTRYGRLPGGWNNKESLNKPHQVTAYKDTRGCKYYTPEQIIEAYKLDLDAVAHLSGRSIEGSVDQFDQLIAVRDPIYKIFEKEGLIKYQVGEKIEVTCPWVDTHTDGIDNGTALLIQPGGGLGFKCHHGHCQHKTLKDVHTWARETSPEQYESFYSKKEPNENVEDTLESKLQQLIDVGIDGSELTRRLNDLAKEYRERPERLEKQFSQMRAEVEAQKDAAEAITQLDDLEAIKGNYSGLKN